MGTAFGFPDWQKQQPLDGPLLLDINALAALQGNTFGPVYVGRWARIAGDALLTGQPALWSFRWYADQAATKLLGVRQLLTEPAIANPLRFMLPNLGPWVTVGYQTANVLPNRTLTHHLYGTNREQPGEIIPQIADLLSVYGTNIAAGGTAQVLFANYYSGPATLWHTSPTARLDTSLQELVDTAGTYQTFAEVVSPNSSAFQQVMIPPSACRAVLNNVEAFAANFYVKVVADYTA